MKNWLSEQAQNQPQKLALVCGDQQWTYGELADEARRWAALFETCVGDAGAERIALCGPNRAQSVFAAHGAWWCGASVVGLHHRATKAELEAQLGQIEPSLVIGADEVDVGPWPSMSWSEAGRRARDMTADLAPRAVEPDQVMTILFTSGSSGRPKAVPLTVSNHLASAQATAERLDVGQGDRWLCCLPLCHIGGLAIVIRCAVYGATVELMEDFDAEVVLERLAKRPVTMASFVPTMLVRILQRAGEEVNSQLRCVLIGGGAIGNKLLARARKANIPVVSTYGMTEATSQITTLSPTAPPRYLHTAGRPLSGVEVEIRDDSGAPVETSESGEVGAIFVRGATITPGYLDAENKRDESQWFETGDFGHIDEEGRLVIDPRRGERIVSGGENVDPRQVEAVLLDCDQVADVAVVGVDDPTWGQVVAALVVASDKEQQDELDFDKLAKACRRELAPFKVPRRWASIHKIPRTVSEKTKRDEVRRYLAGHN